MTQSQVTESLRELFTRHTGSAPTSIVERPSSGSNRRYFRLKNDDTSIIGVIGTCKDENEAFIYIDEHFENRGLPVPKVLAVSNDHMSYIQEDLGDCLLFNAIEKGRETHCFSPEERELLEKTITRLPEIQFSGAVGLNFSKCYPPEEFDMRTIMWDLNYFKYCFLKATGIDFLENKLEDDFTTLAEVLLRSKSGTFMYRDFQSRNVMIKDGEPWFIDFQGGRKGPYYYDVASFLWQAKANFTSELRNYLIQAYIKSLRRFKTVDEPYFLGQLRHFVLFRIMQVLGAYGFRGYFEKKPHFLQSVPYAITNLRELLQEPFTEYPYLNDLLTRMCDMKQFSDLLKRKTLTVRVMSFAYKKGIPNDASGNGGGYVFDCRGVNNPGKYEMYKPFNGLDEPVIKYLEEDGEILKFLDHCYALVDSTIIRYVERGFQNLMVCFGCTGGQHRSVYCAQHMAEHIHKNFNVKVDLVHREQDIEQEFPVK